MDLKEAQTQTTTIIPLSLSAAVFIENDSSFSLMSKVKSYPDLDSSSIHMGIMFARAKSRVFHTEHPFTILGMHCPELGTFLPYTLLTPKLRPISQHLTFSRLTPQSSWPRPAGRAIVSFSLKTHRNVKGEPAMFPFLLSETSSEAGPLPSRKRSRYSEGFLQGDAKCHENLRDFLDKLQFVGKLGGKSSGNSMKWLSMSTKQGLAW